MTDVHDVFSVGDSRPWRSVARLVGAVVSGVLAGAMMSSAIMGGAEYYYSNENPDANWGLLFWGEHWLLRGFASITAAIWGSFIAGVIARSRGGVIAILAAAPAALIWAVGAVWAWQSTADHALPNLLLAPALTLLLPCIAYKVGEASAPFGKSAARHFDSRPRTLLGIRWVHYLWISAVVNALAMQTAWIVIYGAGWLRASFALGPNFLGVVPGLFLMGILGTLALTLNGLARAYGILAGFAVVQRGSGRAVIKHACGWPLLAILLQQAIVGVHYLLSRLFG